MEFGVRQPAVAGAFYPRSKNDLVLMLEKFFQSAKNIQKSKIKAIIVPHAGYIYSGQTAAWGYYQLSSSHLENPHFVLIGPSHYFLFDGLVCSSFKYWLTPLGKIRHQPWSKADDNIFIDNQPHLNEHSLEVQLPFLQYLYRRLSISGFLTSQQIKFEETARQLLKNYPSSIYIISSDLSHYLPEVQAREKDKNTIEAILKLDLDYFRYEDNSACGANGIGLLLSMARIKGWLRKLVYYDTSFTASGDRNQVVGYCSIVFYQ
ncbi:MAG: AmmeMemoRadiSam system protein B [Microgenomates group bacterium]|nr:AmmeMemoRadiSam system protein B [Microgenomates group bacterium]